MPPRGNAEHTRHTVLVVEDDRDSREALALLLEVEGFGVATVANGVEALHMMTTLGYRPCVVVVDLIMPMMDGLSMRQRMAEDAELADIPVVCLTGHEGLRRQALTEGFAAAFLKPGRIDDIVVLVGKHCASSSRAATTKRGTQLK